MLTVNTLTKSQIRSIVMVKSKNVLTIWLNSRRREAELMERQQQRRQNTQYAHRPLQHESHRNFV